MKNILLITKIYPSKDLPNNDTKVVHYFAKEWKKMGYNVMVIHNFVLFPPFVYWITKLFSSKLAAIFGAVVPTVYDSRIREYQYDGIDVVRIPLMKFVPHGMFSEKTIKKHYGRISTILKECDFVPDYVIGHWWNPQLQLFEHFKEEYKAKTCLTVHDFSKQLDAVKYRCYFDYIDIFGMRSHSIERTFKEIFGYEYKTFYCASGIPEKFVVGSEFRDFSKPIGNFCYVGTMIKRKYPIALLQAIDLVQGKLSSFHVDYVGEGAETSRIKRFLNKVAWKNSVNLHGMLTREQVSSVLRKAECFVMISKNEAFGLVYLEAMGCGCIPVASRDEGMDGIIIDGENGFLCQSGNYNELGEIILKINALSSEERKRLSDNAVKTAAYYTDSLAAKRYIDNVKMLN